MMIAAQLLSNAIKALDDYEDKDDEDDCECDEHDGPEVLSAARHGQHDQPGQTNARQPEQELH